MKWYEDPLPPNPDCKFGGSCPEPRNEPCTCYKNTDISFRNYGRSLIYFLGSAGIAATIIYYILYFFH